MSINKMRRRVDYLLIFTTGRPPTQKDRRPACYTVDSRRLPNDARASFHCSLLPCLKAISR